MLFFFGQAKKRGRASFQRRSIVKLFYNLMQPTTCWIDPPRDLIYTVKGEINKDSTPCSPCSLGVSPICLILCYNGLERERGKEGSSKCKIIEKVGG